MRALVAISTLLALTVICGCGVIDEAKQKASNAVRGEIANQCRKRAREIKDTQARKTALQACEAARTGDTDAVRRKLQKECLDRAREVSDSSSRRRAESQCRAIGAGGHE